MQKVCEIRLSQLVLSRIVAVNHNLEKVYMLVSRLQRLPLIVVL